MKLADAARFFDRLVCADAYDPASTFLGQLDLFDDSRRDGTTVTRRVLSTAPDTVMPARGVITAQGATWLVGQDQPDTFGDRVIRRKFILHDAQALAVRRTPGQLLTGAAGVSAYAARSWIKAQKEIEISSRLFNLYHVFFTASESVAVGSVIEMMGVRHFVRNIFAADSGLQVAQCDELPAGCVQAGTYRSQLASYNPVTDVMTGTDIALNVLKVRWQVDFDYDNQAAETYSRGDAQIFVAKSAVTAQAGDRVTLADGAWLIEGVDDTGDAWSCHVRHA